MVLRQLILGTELRLRRVSDVLTDLKHCRIWPEATTARELEVFFAFNELCRPLHKDPQSTRSKYVRHAAWQFMKLG